MLDGLRLVDPRAYAEQATRTPSGRRCGSRSPSLHSLEVIARILGVPERDEPGRCSAS
jgi:hypothetical protein